MATIYTKAKIYRLLCDDGHYYVGSTTNTLDGRLSNHKQTAKTEPSRLVYKHINTIGWDHVKMELIEDFPCNSKEELTKQEDFYIKELKSDELCLNFIRSNVPYEERKTLIKEYYETHKENIIEQHKDYIEQNKEKADQYQADYRLINAEKRREYSKNYAKEHPEANLEYMKNYYEENKDKIKETNKKYVEANKELVAERKRIWSEKRKETIREQREETKEERLKVKAQHKLEKKANDEQVIMCECGGSYQPYRKSRHDSSKKHQKFIEV